MRENPAVLTFPVLEVWYKRLNSGTNEIQNSSRGNTRCKVGEGLNKKKSVGPSAKQDTNRIHTLELQTEILYDSMPYLIGTLKSAREVPFERLPTCSKNGAGPSQNLTPKWQT
eukprot:1352098-Rhodomonas_salina.1